MTTPPPIATEAFTDAASAVARLEEIYERNTKFLRDKFEAYRRTIMSATMLAIRGHVQREGIVIHVVADRIDQRIHGRVLFATLTALREVFGSGQESAKRESFLTERAAAS